MEHEKNVYEVKVTLYLQIFHSSRVLLEVSIDIEFSMYSYHLPLQAMLQVPNRPEKANETVEPTFRPCNHFCE
jgi:hypothetical protein